MTPIKGSSNVAAADHDAKSSALSVRFHNGSIYHYANVTTAQHKAMLAAPSVGEWLIAHIVKKPQAHPFKKGIEKK